jgi:ATP-binding cassette subfamily F protein 3
MLDEPTNHLDLHSVELLIEALNRYEGSMIFVSHDRYFISKTANKIWEIEDGKIREFKGTYEEYVDWKSRLNVRQKETAVQAPAEKKVKEEKKREPIDTARQKEEKKLQKKFSEVEALVANLQKKKAASEALLADPAIYSDKTKFIDAEKQYQSVSQSLSRAEQDYEKLFEEIMKHQG